MEGSDMAKINRFIASFSMTVKDLDISFEDTDINPPKSVIRRFVKVFKQIDDPREQGMIDYPLVEVLLIAFLAILGGASGWNEINRFGVAKQRWLKKFLELKNGIPSHDTFYRVFALLDTEQLQEATVSFLMENIQAIKKVLPKVPEEYRHLCVDGKEQRGTGRNYDTSDKIKNLQTLHIYDATNEICIHSEAIDEKTNEIPVAQNALKKMCLKQTIVTYDALHMQKETVAIIRDRKGDYVGGLKGNQAGLLEEAETYFNEDDLLEYYRSKGDYHETSEKAHGKIETRKYYLVRPTKRKIIKEWKGLKAFICCIKTIKNTKDDKVRTEKRYYAASIDDIVLCAEAIRGHWSVENKLHWHLDHSMGEDDNTTMDKNAFHNLSLINKMVLTLCKLAKQVTNAPSVRIQRKIFGWAYEDTLGILLYCFDDKTIRDALESVKA